MANEQTLLLADVPRELAALADGRTPTYQQVWGMAVNGRLPAEKVNGRYWVARADLPAIALSLGMRLKADASPAKPRKAAAAPATA